MAGRRPEDERMCETSEKTERIFSDDEILPINLDIGCRIMEVFGNQNLSNITFRLRSTSREINAVLDGKQLPSCELLLGIHRITGVSIDWLLTGEGEKFPLKQEISRGEAGIPRAAYRPRPRPDRSGLIQGLIP